MHAEGTNVIFELVQNMLHSSVEGTIGVIAIFSYLAVILVASIYRIHEGMKEGGH